MQGEDLKTQVERFSTLLFFQLQAQLPRPGGIHKYSKGKLLRNYKMYKIEDGYEIVISENTPYARFAMGYKVDCSKRQPRGPLERINFKTVDNCIQSVSNLVAIPTGGKVVSIK